VQHTIGIEQGYTNIVHITPADILLPYNQQNVRLNVV